MKLLNVKQPRTYLLGTCVQMDDMEKVMPAYKEADMVVYASPIYYFGMTAQISAASPNPFSGAIATYKDMTAYMGLEDAGIITAVGEENGSEAKLAEIRAFAKGL